jgi:DNA-binding NarL/FixJ family response regulator
MHSIFIVDDHPVIRLSVRMLLENQNYKIVGESDNGVDAMQMIRESNPDLVILDISIPKLDGLEVLARFQSMALPLKVLVLTAQSPALFAVRCMHSGAAGYVCKQEDLSELLSAIKAVLAGYNYFPMLEAPDLMAACEALEASDLPTAQVRLRRQALARHMCRVERALAKELATSTDTQAGNHTC